MKQQKARSNLAFLVKSVILKLAHYQIKEQVMDQRVKRFLKNELTCSRMPTMKECIDAIEHPEAASEEVKEYLRLRPEFDQDLRSILEMMKE